MVPYDPIWSCMVPYGPVWKYGQVWSGMVTYGPVWSPMVQYGPVWSDMVRYGPVWSGMVRYGLLWSGMVRYGPVWSSIILERYNLGAISSYLSFYGSLGYYCLCQIGLYSVSITVILGSQYFYGNRLTERFASHFFPIEIENHMK